MRKLPINRTRKEEYHDDRGRDPERAIEIWVAVEGVEEVCARVQGSPAALEHFSGVDVEELLVEVDAPEIAL